MKNISKSTIKGSRTRIYWSTIDGSMSGQVAIDDGILSLMVTFPALLFLTKSMIFFTPKILFGRFKSHWKEDSKFYKILLCVSNSVHITFKYGLEFDVVRALTIHHVVSFHFLTIITFTSKLHFC